MFDKLDDFKAVVAAKLSPSSIWRALPFVAAGSVFVIVAGSIHRAILEPQPDRLQLAAVIAAPLVALAFLLFIYRKDRLLSWQKRTNGSSVWDRPWTTALLLTLAVGMVGLGVVGLFALYPPGIEKSTLKAWGYLDKRWMIILYLLGIGLVYLPGLCKRAIDALAPSSDETATSRRAWFPQDWDGFWADAANLLNRGLAASIIGCVLAVLYVSYSIPGTLERPLDAHEALHLGSLQAISQGAQPYIEAQTQYGPGHQLATYKLMQSTEFTLRGFRAAHLVINMISVALLFSLLLFAFGWPLGVGAIFVALMVSPLLAITWLGWGILPRWIGPVVVGALAPLILWSDIRTGLRYPLFLGIGAVCGGLAWFAQENFSTSILTAFLILAAAIICGRTSIRTGILLAMTFVVVETATLMFLLSWLVGPGHLAQAFSMYMRWGSLVFSGIANATWAEPKSGWKWAYYLAPVIIAGITALALYPLRYFGQLDGNRGVGQLLGMAAAAASLALLPMFRADTVHFIGPSTALAPFMVLSVAYLPNQMSSRFWARMSIRAALIIAFLQIYPFPPGIGGVKENTHLMNLEKTYAGLGALHDLWRGESTAGSGKDFDDLVRRLGFRPRPEEPCCSNNDWSYQELAQALREIRSAAAGRSVLVEKMTGVEASSVYFLADLPVSTDFAEPLMSIWVDDDLRAAKQDLLNKKPDCLVTSDPELPRAKFLLDLYKDYTEFKIPSRINVSVYCRKNPF